MDVDEALYAVENLGPDHLPDAAHALAAGVRQLRAELAQYRATVTTGGPAPGFTGEWQNGASSRPSTAPPEEIVVALPVTDEEVAEYAPCTDCGHRHPAWISCEKETELRHLADKAADER